MSVFSNLKANTKYYSEPLYLLDKEKKVQMEKRFILLIQRTVKKGE
jgi:hypothetical protein